MVESLTLDGSPHRQGILLGIFLGDVALLPHLPYSHLVDLRDNVAGVPRRHHCDLGIRVECLDDFGVIVCRRLVAS